MTTITYTSRPLLERLRNALRRAYLRTLIAAAEQDAAVHDMHAAIEPQLAQMAREKAAELRVELAQL